MRHRSHVLFTWINDMIRHPKILDAMEDLLGPNILCWNTSFFIKEPHDPGFVSWHQDATYWGLEFSDVATAWIAMSPANKVSGCMKFVAGTHKQQVKHEDTFDQNNLLTRGQEIAVEGRRGQGSVCRAEARPGFAAPRAAVPWIGTEPFSTIGVSVWRSLHPDTSQAGGRATGLGDAGARQGHLRHFQPEYVPKKDLEPEALAFHKMVSDEQVRVLYRGTDKTRTVPSGFCPHASARDIRPSPRPADSPVNERDSLLMHAVAANSAGRFLALDLGKQPHRKRS
jgi:hypothetical protein